jgi:hypothetical protein
MRYIKIYINKYLKRLRLSIKVIKERYIYICLESSIYREHYINIIMGYKCDKKICPLGPIYGNRANLYLKLGVAIRLISLSN